LPRDLDRKIFGRSVPGTGSGGVSNGLREALKAAVKGLEASPAGGSSVKIASDRSMQQSPGVRVLFSGLLLFIAVGLGYFIALALIHR
jgi:hypothetical protein